MNNSKIIFDWWIRYGDRLFNVWLNKKKVKRYIKNTFWTNNTVK